MKHLLIIMVWLLSGCRFFRPVEPIVIDGVTFNADFDKTPKASLIEKGIVDEASGIADSFQFPGNIWIHEDGNTTNQIYLFSHSGTLQGKVQLPMPNYDWEDMVIAPGPIDSKKYVYLADIGDNFSNRESYHIYRFLEPTIKEGQWSEFDDIAFEYPNKENLDAEAFLVDPKSKDIYIFTKNLSKTKVYKLPYPQAYGQNVTTAEYVKDLPFFILTSAGFSADGQEIVLKNYAVIYYWHVKKEASLMTTLSRAPDKYQPYEAEAQGEAFSFGIDSKSYFTLSERRNEDKTIALKQYFRTVK